MTNSIMQQIKENKEKEVGCQFHEFVIEKFASKHDCKNCGTRQPPEFILGYIRGLEIAVRDPIKAQEYLNFVNRKT